MSKIDLGPVGVVLNPESSGEFVRTATAADEMGYSTIWLTGGPLERLSQIVVRFPIVSIPLISLWMATVSGIIAWFARSTVQSPLARRVPTPP